MTENIDLYKSIAAREKASRKEAERLLEEKSRELFSQQEALEVSTAHLKKTATLLSEIMRVAPDGVYMISSSLKLHDCNAAATEQLKMSRGEMCGHEAEEYFPGITRVLADAGDGYFSLEQFRVRSADGSSFPAEVRGYHGPIGSERIYLLFVHDIAKRVASEKKRTRIEQQLDEARRLEAIGALSAGIAHEINTPIQFIGDNLAFLQEALKKIHISWRKYEGLRSAVAQDEAYKDLVKDVDDHSKEVRLDVLVKDIFECLQESQEGIAQVRDIVLLMKEFSHPGSGESDDVDINRLIRNALNISKRNIDSGIIVEQDLSENLPELNCRQSQLQQVILNLVLNAVDAIKDKREEGGKIRISTKSVDGFVQIRISDNGGGVPQSLRQKIFDPFFTTKPVGKGTGQGLALAKDVIVKGHSGRLTLVDEASFDTTFLIELPMAHVMEEIISAEEHDVTAA
ncbi:ATP-binding protein [Parvularcula marina]|uniref:PAS domain-containing sensor histidine kinase n=1 Tax=Parvularcula marina TaxID=2292771 RepID=UPI0035184678